MSHCNTFYASLEMEVSTHQTRKGHAGSFINCRSNTPQLSGCHSHLPLYYDKEDVQRDTRLQKMWTPMTETNNICWDLSMNLIWLLAARHQLWAALQSSTVQLLSQPFKNFSWNKANSCKWSVKQGNEHMLSRNTDQKGMGILHHTTCCAPKQRGSSKQHPKWN